MILNDIVIDWHSDVKQTLKYWQLIRKWLLKFYQKNQVDETYFKSNHAVSVSLTLANRLSVDFRFQLQCLWLVFFIVASCCLAREVVSCWGRHFNPIKKEKDFPFSFVRKFYAANVTGMATHHAVLKLMDWSLKPNQARNSQTIINVCWLWNT